MLFKLLLISILLGALKANADPLPSWHDGEARTRIIDFVTNVTTPGEAYVPPAERIAVFDNDGTLWAEQPLYFQLQFALDRVPAVVADNPALAKTPPFNSVLKHDREAMAAFGHKEIAQILLQTHSGMTTDEFADVVNAWIDTARHPGTDRPYTEMVYQPMLELLAFLQLSGFKTYIVSGGGVAFMRTFSERVYGIPPEQVIGSSVQVEYTEVEGQPRLIRKPGLSFIDDKEGKPVAINLHIGRIPILAFGNSDGDLQMLKWADRCGENCLIGIVHHNDAEREWAYDRDSHIGRLDKALDAAGERRWLVVDMKSDWLTVFPR